MTRIAHDILKDHSTRLLDPIRLAQTMRYPLLSDDLHYRQLAALAGVNASTWL